MPSQGLEWAPPSWRETGSARITLVGPAALDNQCRVSSPAMTIALLIALAGSLALMAYIVKRLENA